MSAIDTAITNIENYIIENGNEEITANVLRPLLVGLANAVKATTGDPENLNTEIPSGELSQNLVGAINSLKAITDSLNGVVIKIGTADPNVTPPISFAIGNFYVRSVLGSVLSFWQYNGIEWVEIKRYKGYTVSGLPAGAIGDKAYVTDATSPTYLGTLTGGGAVKCPVFFDGTNWVSH